MPHDPEALQIHELFNIAVEMSQSEREVFLPSACGDDAALRLEIEELLDAFDPGFLELAPQTDVPEVTGYKLEGPPHYGGTSVVYKAQDLKLGRVVALKMIPSVLLASEADLKRFRREAELVASLHHQNIVQIYAIGETKGTPFLSLEYCPSHLKERLRDGPIAPFEAAVLVEKMAIAVHFAHQRGIIHRDLKPANVLFSEDGTPKIADFGLAKNIDVTTTMTMNGAIMGTPCYMAPEQAEGRNQGVGIKADVYALGIILYECLTGVVPFKGETSLETCKLG